MEEKDDRKTVEGVFSTHSHRKVVVTTGTGRRVGPLNLDLEVPSPPIPLLSLGCNMIRQTNLLSTNVVRTLSVNYFDSVRPIH